MLVPALIAWVLTLKLFGFVGLATIAAAMAMPLFVLVTAWPEHWPLFLFSSLLGLFVFFTHRSNVRKFVSRDSSVDVKPWIDTGRS